MEVTILLLHILKDLMVDNMEIITQVFLRPSFSLLSSPAASMTHNAGPAVDFAAAASAPIEKGFAFVEEEQDPFAFVNQK